MTIKTILFSPLNGTGHINALMGIADRLKDEHGYRTVFLLMGQTTSTSIEEHGHELFIIDQNTGELEKKNKYAKSNEWNEMVEKMHKMMRMEPIDMAPETIHGRESFGYLCKDQWVRNHACYAKAIQFINPDLILLDTWTVPPCILQLKHVPWVYVCSSNPFSFLCSKLPDGIKPPRFVGARLYSREERARMRQEEPNKWLTLLEEWRRLNAKVETKQPQAEHQEFNKLYRNYGFEPIEPNHLGHHSPHLNLYMYPKELDYGQEDDLFEYPARWFRYDIMIRKDISFKESEIWSNILDKAMIGKTSMIYFSLGTFASGDLELMRRYLNMFKDDKKRLYVISQGPRGDLIELPSENMIGANYLPQALILKRANLAIIHGGNNSTTECLYNGVPMIVLPCFGDQLDNAQRVEDLKLGRRFFSHKCEKEEMMAAIDELMEDQELAYRVRLISEKMKARDDAKEVLLMLKKLTVEKKLDECFIDDCRTKSVNNVR